MNNYENLNNNINNNMAALPNIFAWVDGDTDTNAGSQQASPAPSSRSSVSWHTEPSAQSTRRGGVRPAQVVRDVPLETLERDLKIAELEDKLAELRESKSKKLTGRMPTFGLPFFLKKSKMEFLQRRFPRTTFSCTSDNHHDHPLAHTETMIATGKMQRMVDAGNVMIDYFGSVSACDDFNRKQARSTNPKRAVAYIDRLSPKAYIRHRTIGEPIVNGNIRYVEAVDGVAMDLQATSEGIHLPGLGQVPGESLTWTFKHSLYYLSDEQIQDCLNVQGSRMLAVVHRHIGDSGQLFDGECTFAKVEGTVEQINTLTGEGYVHRDLSWLWDSRSKVKYNANGAFTWTFHMVSEETWIVELVAIPLGLDERFTKQKRVLGHNTAANELNDASLVPTPFPHPALADMPDASCTMVGGVPVIKFGDADLPNCKVTSPELYEYLLASMSGKPRDPNRLQDLFALARSHCLSTSEFPGKKNFGVRAADIGDHVFLAFVSGLKKETRMLRAITCHDVWAREHNALLDGVHVFSGGKESAAHSVIQMAKRVNMARKTGDTFDGILAAIQ